MPSFKFDGFATGTAVAMAAQQGAQTAQASVTAWGQPDTSTMTVDLTATRMSGVAPFGAMYLADATSTEAAIVSPFHDIEGIWSYDDPGDFTALDNSPLWGTDWNVGYGPRGVHIHRDPGTYNVAWTAYDGTSSATAVSDGITVEDPDTVFAGADTAVVSAAGDFTGKPTGASEFTTISAAVAHIEARTNGRLLLRADETFTDPVVIDKGGRTYVGRFGHSADERPLLDMSGSGATAVRISGTAHTEITICDLRIRGAFDPTATSQPSAPGGSGIDLSGSGYTDKPMTAHKTIWNVDMENIGNMCLDATGVRADQPGSGGVDTPMTNLYVGNCRWIGWYNYGCLVGDGGYYGFAGCVFKQPTGTVNGQSKSGPAYWADHGPFRVSRPNGPMVFSNCDFASFNSWAASSSNRSFQDLIRWNEGIPDQELVIDRFRGEGGNMKIYNSTGGGAGVTDNFVVVDRWHVISSDHAQFAVNSPMGGVTWRNGVAVVPNTVPGTSTGTQRMFSDAASDAVPGAQTRRSEFYSCSLVDLRSDANATNRVQTASRDFTVGQFEAIADAFFGNNILHAPNNIGGGEAGQAPLDAAAQWTVWYDGERWEGAPVDTSRAYDNTPTASFRPRPGSTAIGGASGKVSLLDFDGILRSDILAGLTRSTPSAGPYEPNVEN